MTSDSLAAVVAFTEARLTEDKRKAEGLLFATRIPEKKSDFWDYGGPAAEAYWEHFGPRRILLDVEATRKLLDLYRHAEQTCPSDSWESDYTQALEDAVRIHAARWADHPDYRKEWAA